MQLSLGAKANGNLAIRLEHLVPTFLLQSVFSCLWWVFFAEFAVDHLDIPTLVIAGSNDTICPIEPVRRMVERHAYKQERPKLTLKEFPLRHFEFLNSQNFPVLMQTTASFLKEHL